MTVFSVRGHILRIVERRKDTKFIVEGAFKKSSYFFATKLLIPGHTKKVRYNYKKGRHREIWATSLICFVRFSCEGKHRVFRCETVDPELPLPWRDWLP